jgi:hypothetical protein
MKYFIKGEIERGKRLMHSEENFHKDKMEIIENAFKEKNSQIIKGIQDVKILRNDIKNQEIQISQQKAVLT